MGICLQTSKSLGGLVPRWHRCFVFFQIFRKVICNISITVHVRIKSGMERKRLGKSGKETVFVTRSDFIVFIANFYEGKSVDPLAESLDCSQAKKGGPKIHNPFADCNKENCKALASKSSNNGGTSKRNPILEIGSLSFPKLQTMVHINLASPRNHFEMINSINQMDQNVTVSIIC
ncbi:hypothetical protein DAPPUDRAFT_117767 [Daphnia pulex]|uniref:Uncharacterized protein n=1 Tax=Daphnia pulex TaxID=6669 RepID=E9HTR1_DAPPU|nr:hypothetical protein DAPPUDRAFT_117767 [Daphnia pulex]|eukprot:EFX64877.1 hypothetical protein DAPPUDRAFT_117767 [Daphnia pulex]